MEVNGNPVVGLDPEQVIQILVGQLATAAPAKLNSEMTWNLCQMDSPGTILFKVVPNETPASGSCHQSVRNSHKGFRVGLIQVHLIRSVHQHHLNQSEPV